MYSAFLNRMFYQDGTLLANLLGEPLFARASQLLSLYGIPGELATTMKPWAAYVTLSMPPDSGPLPLDMVLSLRASGQGKSVYGLETLEEQVASLAGLEPDVQKELLRDTVCHYKTVQQDIEEMKQLYLARDLGGLMSMTEKYDVQSDAHYEDFMESLLWERNGRMFQRMEEHLKAGNSFIAVGALHLPGAKGLLRMLESDGYQVTSVY